VSGPIIVDSCGLLHLANGRITDGTALSALTAARQARQAFVPAIMALEVAQKVAKGRLDVGMAPRIWWRTMLARYELRELPIRSALALAAYELPEPFHGGPADRLIVAAARRVRGMVLTCDGKILTYAKAGHVAVLPYRGVRRCTTFRQASWTNGPGGTGI
jgi:PIN domain nuclease of toxin-antitoxin system